MVSNQTTSQEHSQQHRPQGPANLRARARQLIHARQTLPVLRLVSMVNAALLLMAETSIVATHDEHQTTLYQANM